MIEKVIISTKEDIWLSVYGKIFSGTLLLGVVDKIIYKMAANL